MEKLVIENALKEYADKKPKRFHMPGHKADKQFAKKFPVAEYDITELDFSDSLSCPTGIIKQAETEVGEILGSKRSYFLTDGSTCGVFSMLYAVREKGSKIIINRNAHQSVYNACKLFNIEPIAIDQNLSKGIMLPPTPDQMENRLGEDDVIGMLLTYPDYYGFTFDIAAARKLCDKYGKVLLIDGAHGAHLRFSGVSAYQGDYADIWVDGVHKTLPCLTQTAVLNVGNKTLIPKVTNAVNIFRTSSPSYPLMSSIEYGEKFMHFKGKELLSKVRVEVLALKSRLNAKGIKTVNSDDPFKLAVDFRSMDVCPYKAEKYLNGKNIYCEMNDGRYLLFLFSASTPHKWLVKLEKALYKTAKLFKGTYVDRLHVTMGVKKMSYLQANNGKKQSVELKESAGMVLAENVGVFPPCFPLCLAGEIMTQEIIEVLLNAKYTFGITNGRVKVIKE